MNKKIRGSINQDKKVPTLVYLAIIFIVIAWLGAKNGVAISCIYAIFYGMERGYTISIKWQDSEFKVENTNEKTSK